ncbi:MAG: hypothetical protein NT154_37205 [Verrucomicrobia bacterium]|nr:hypothetical protein [Verrucomicrobiota bacterium]
MRFLPREVESRREFFRATVRYALLALVSAAASLAARPRTAGGQRCVNRGICTSCGAFPGCGLPQALSAKRAQENG